MIFAGRQIPLKFTALLLVGVIVSGCASAPNSEISNLTSKTLSGRIVDSGEIGVFYGDVELVWYAYVVEPVGASGRQVVVVGDDSECPKAGSQLYSMLLERQNVPFAIQHTDKSAMSDWVIISCRALET